MHRSQFGNSVLMDANDKVKRTTSFFTLRNPTFYNQHIDENITNAIVSPSPMFQYLPQKRTPGIHRFQLSNKSPSRLEIDQNNNPSPPIITMPHLMEFSKRVSRSASVNDQVMLTMDTNADSNQSTPLAKNDAPVSHTKSFAINNDAHTKRFSSQKTSNYIVKQPLSSMDYTTQERFTTSEHGQNNNINYQSNATDRMKQIVKKQLFFPFEKTRKL